MWKNNSLQIIIKRERAIRLGLRKFQASILKKNTFGSKENLKETLLLILETNRLLNAPKRGQKVIREDLILTLS